MSAWEYALSTRARVGSSLLQPRWWRSKAVKASAPKVISWAAFPSRKIEARDHRADAHHGTGDVRLEPDPWQPAWPRWPAIMHYRSTVALFAAEVNFGETGPMNRAGYLRLGTLSRVTV
jgi:hypothetical protein